jgi:uncharacterized protein
MTELRGPVQASERIPTLDIVRGFALLGILIMNMPGFSTSFFAEADGSHLWAGALDQRAEQIRDMLFSGKFNSMFSLLFGIGFTIQLGRMLERDPEHGATLYVRRLLVLAVFALVHCLILWTGDVLHIYVALGFGLLLIRRIPNRAVVALIIALICYPAITGTIRLLVMSPERVALLVKDAQAWEASNNLAYGHGTFFDAAREHTREMTHVYTNPWELWGILGFWVQMATTMLLGFLIGRNGWVYRIPELMPIVRRLQWGALALGVVCSLTFGIVAQYTRTPGPSALKILVAMSYVLSRLGMMSFYVLTIVRLAQIPAWQRRFHPIAMTGRMPLTNYLTQTVIGTALFYGWGFGLWGKVGPALQLVMAFAIFFVIQVPLSTMWLRHFEYGPLEYVWRLGTYGRRAPVVAASASA